MLLALLQTYVDSHLFTWKEENNYKKISQQIVVSKQSFITKHGKPSTVPIVIEEEKGSLSIIIAIVTKDDELLCLMSFLEILRDILCYFYYF